MSISPPTQRDIIVPASKLEAIGDNEGATIPLRSSSLSDRPTDPGKGWAGDKSAVSNFEESIAAGATIEHSELGILTRQFLSTLVETRYVSPTKRWEGIQKELRRLESRTSWIAGLQDDWDDCGTPAYDKRTIRAALSFVEELARLAVDAGEDKFPLPRLCPGIDGAIDIYWEELGKPYLIVRVSAISENVIAYFFQRSGDNAWLKAEFPHSSRSRERALRSLLPWIIP